MCKIYVNDYYQHFFFFIPGTFRALVDFYSHVL